MAKKKQFRVKTIKRGFITLYQSQIKTFFGWKSIYCANDGEWFFHHSPGKSKSTEKDTIENFRMGAGLNKDQIEIIEA